MHFQLCTVFNILYVFAAGSGKSLIFVAAVIADMIEKRSSWTILIVPLLALLEDHTSTLKKVMYYYNTKYLPIRNFKLLMVWLMAHKNKRYSIISEWPNQFKEIFIITTGYFWIIAEYGELRKIRSVFGALEILDVFPSYGLSQAEKMGVALPRPSGWPEVAENILKIFIDHKLQNGEGFLKKIPKNTQI